MRGSKEYYNYLYQTIEDRPTEELDVLYDGLYQRAEELFAIDNFQGVREGRVVLKIMYTIREEITSRVDEQVASYCNNIYGDMFVHEGYGDERVNWLYDGEE